MKLQGKWEWKETKSGYGNRMGWEMGMEMETPWEWEGMGINIILAPI